MIWQSACLISWSQLFISLLDDGGKNTAFGKGDGIGSECRLDFNKEWHHGQRPPAPGVCATANDRPVSACQPFHAWSGLLWQPQNFKGWKLSGPPLPDTGFSQGISPGKYTCHPIHVLVGTLFQFNPSVEWPFQSQPGKEYYFQQAKAGRKSFLPLCWAGSLGTSFWTYQLSTGFSI